MLPRHFVTGWRAPAAERQVNDVAPALRDGIDHFVTGSTTS